MKKLFFSVLLSTALFPVLSTHANATNAVVKESSMWITLDEIIKAQPDIAVIINGTPKYDLSSYRYEVHNYQDLYNQYGPNWRSHVLPDGPFLDANGMNTGYAYWGGNSVTIWFF